jgi:Tol biopolymer transport system component
VFLPDGQHLLFLAQTGEATSKDDASTIETLALASGARTVLVRANSSPLYTAEGFLLFWREGALRAQAFDASRRTVTGAVFSVAAGVAFDSNEHAQATVSDTGTLVYSTAGLTDRSDLLVVDRAGRPLKTIADSVLVEGGLALSHDGTRVAAAVTADGARNTKIWVYDLLRGVEGPLTFDDGSDFNPVWSADDKYVIYGNDRKNDGIVFKRLATGQGQSEQLASNAVGMWPWGWSQDGTWLLLAVQSNATGIDLLRYDIASQKMSPLVDSPFADDMADLSPDDRWLAYQSEESGRREVYVLSLAGDGGRRRISTAGGALPSWGRNGRELYFLTPQGRLMAVDVEPGSEFRFSAPRELFRAAFKSVDDATARAYAATPDGQRFVVDVLKERSVTLLTLVTNWTTATSESTSQRRDR